MIDILKDERFLTTARRLCELASSSIYISTFKAEMTTKKRGAKLKEFFDLLIRAAAEGVDVRLITNGVQKRSYIPDSNIYALRTLKRTKVKVRVLPNGRVCHSKIIIVDREMALLGSHNLSVKSCHNNFEVSCLISDMQPVFDLLDIYQEVWDAGKPI